MTESTVHFTFEVASNICTTYHRMSCENVLFPPQICLSVSCFCLFLKQATCALPLCTSGRRRHLRGFDRQINYHPYFSAFFQINPNRRERRHEKRHCCVADVMCSGSFGQLLLGWGSLELQEADRFPSAWPSNCRGSPNNGIPLLLDANTRHLLDAGLGCLL